MIRHLKRYLAVRSHMYRLTRELVRRFGKRCYYSVDHVTQAVQRGGLSAAFIAYAHTAFCRQADSDAHYEPLGVACSHQGLRQTIARRYFSGRSDFDADTIIFRFFQANIAMTLQVIPGQIPTLCPVVVGIRAVE